MNSSPKMFVLLPWLQAWVGVHPKGLLARRCDDPRASTDVSDHLQQISYYLQEMALMTPPVGLEATVRVLEQQGNELADFARNVRIGWPSG